VAVSGIVEALDPSMRLAPRAPTLTSLWQRGKNGCWESPRRVVLIRHTLDGEIALQDTNGHQQVLGFVEVAPKRASASTGTSTRC